MLKRTDAITSKVLELLKFVVAYPTVVTVGGTRALCDRLRWDVLFLIAAKRFYLEGPYTFKLSLQIARMPIRIYWPCNFNRLAEATILSGLHKPDA
jgi:hypothetical protein